MVGPTSGYKIVGLAADDNIQQRATIHGALPAQI